MDRSLHHGADPRPTPPSRPSSWQHKQDGTGPRAEACRLPDRRVQPASDRPDLSALKLLQQHQVRRADPGRDQQQREHQRGW